MIQILKTGIKSIVREIWFSDSVNVIDMVSPTIFKQYRGKVPFFFIKEDFYTKIIRLDMDESIIFNNFKTNTKYEVKKAEKEGVEFQPNVSFDDFVSFHNAFSNHKASFESLVLYLKKEYSIITAAKHKQDYLCMHAYLIDKDIFKARLLYSVSRFKDYTDNDMKAFIGRANRYLHYKDIQYFKNEGYLEYDLGGYAYNSNDIKLININNFKDSFGGDIKYEPHLKSLLFFIVKITKNIFRLFMGQF